jgi:hypothetical protein
MSETTSGIFSAVRPAYRSRSCGLRLIDGQAEKTYKTGESFQVPHGAVHAEGARSGTGLSGVIAVFIAEKGKPLVQPAP